MYPLIIFDWDGTLMDSTAVIASALQRAAADLNLAVPSDHDAKFVIGLGIADSVARLFPGLPQSQWQALGDRYRFHFLDREVDCPLFPGAVEMLTALNASGRLLAVATGKSRSGLDRVLARSEMRQQFVVTRCADEGFAKPHPDMILHILDATGMTPQQAVMVGDTTHDLELAKNAGIAGVGVTYGAHSPEALQDFSKYHHSPIIHSIGALKTWLNQPIQR